MNDLSLQAAVVVNSEQAETAFDRVGDKAQQMANEVSTSATKAGQAVDKIGDGAGASAEKFTRAESRISASIKRATTELELLGKTASQRLEFNIADKGLDASKFEPALKKLREIEAQAMQAQRAATGSLDKMGVSAAQTAAALRGVPAQFTDIVTSLQGGQAPLTVFLQQGGQLKDMFGGAGNAARALGGYVLGLVNPFTIAAAAVAGIAVAYNQGAKEADAYRAALVTTGNAAGTTATQLKSYAQEISGVVGTQGKAAESLAAMAATGKIGAESLREAAQAAVAYERATGQAASKTAEQFASLRNEPLAAVLKLNEGMNFLTESTYRQIKSLEEQGKTAEAANVAQRAFADTLSGRAGEMERNLGTVERGWIAVKDAAKSAWDAILNVGRASTSVDQLAEVRKQIAERENQIANGGFGTNEGGAAFGRPSQAATERLRAELAGLQAKAAALEGVAYATKVSADEERKRGEAVKAGAAFDKAGEKFLSDKTRMERELAAARVQGAEAGRSQAEIEKRLGEIRASYAKKGGGGVAAENKELRDQQRIFAELAGVSSTYYTELAAAQAQRAKGNISEAQYVAYVEELIQKQPFAVALAKEETEANKALSKSYAEAAAERIKTIQSMERAADSLQSQNDALRDEIELIGLSTEQQTLVLQQRNDVIILTKEATLAELERQSAITGTQTRVEIALASEIAALKERNALLGAKGVKNAAVDAANTAKGEWQKTTDSINQSLTDSLLRGFESGKDFAKNLRDTVVNMFKTMVLRPVISAIVNPVAGAVTGMMGLSGAANAATGGSNLLGTALQGTSLYNGLTSGTGVLGSIGNAIGLGVGASTTMGSLSATAIGSYATPSVAAMTIAPGAAGAGGASGALAAIPGWGWALAGVALLGSLAKKFDDSGTPHIGAGAVYSESGGLQEGAGIYNRGTFGMGIAEEYAKGAQEGVSTIAKSLTQTFDGIAKAFGQTAGYEIATAFADDSSKGGAWGALRISKDGQELLNWEDTRQSKWAPREFGDGEAGYKEYLAAVAKDTRQVLLDMDLPSWADTMLESIGDAANMDQLSATLQQIGVIQTTFVQLGKTMEGFAGLTDKAFEALMRASGGLEALSANAGTYYENFYSEAEKTAAVTRSVSDALAQVGVAMPATRDDFRALVESQLALGEGGTKAVAALLGVSGAFASVVPAANVLSETMRRLQSDSSSLQIELLQAQGRESDALALRREIETQGFNAAEVAAYDYNQSLRASITATNAASAALKAYKTAASSISTSKDTLAGIVRSPVEIAQNALNQTLLRLNETLKPANVVKDDYTYLSLYQDVLDFWKSESAQGGALAGVSAEEYAQIHYESSGKSEGRMSPQEALDLITTLVPNYNPLTLDDVLKLDTSGQGGYSAEQWEVIADVFAKAANVKLAAETPVTPATSVVDTSNAALSDILQERKTLQERYDELTMTSTQLLEKQRGALHESNRELFDSIQLETKKAAVASERKGLQEEYDSLTLTSAQLLERQRNALDESNRALFDSIQGIKAEATAREAAAQAAAKASSDAFGGLQRAVDAQRKIYQSARDTAQEAVSEITSVFDILKSSVKDLYASADSTAQMQAVQGRAFITQALATAQTTGYLPESKQLSEAINAAKGGTKEFASQFEKDFATLTLASDLSLMESLTKSQLTEAERMLKAADAQLSSLDGILDLAKQQLDAANGINTSVLSVKDALAAFASPIASQIAAAKPVIEPPRGTTPPPVGPSVPTGATGGSLTVGSSTFASAGDAFGVPLYQVGGQVADAATIAQLAALSATLPKFAVGTNYVPRDMLAQIHEGEAIVPRAYNPAANPGMGSGSARLESLVEGLTAEVQRLQAIVNDGNTYQRRTAETLDNVTEGGSNMRTVAA